MPLSNCSPTPVGGEIVFRGGTAIYKLFIQPACRYSEDIDLVQIEAGPIGLVLDAVRANLDPWLGKPTRTRAEDCASLVYRFESEIPPVRPVRLKSRSILGNISRSWGSPVAK